MQKVILFFITNCLFFQLIAQDFQIHLNQLGYYPGAPKIAVISGSHTGNFQIKAAESGKVMFSFSLGEVRKSEFSATQTTIADFTSFKTPGTYVLNVPGIGDSYRFNIRLAIFNGLTRALIKGFYFQRMSMPLAKEDAGKWSRQGGHPDTEVIIHPAAASATRPSGTVISSPGGWYDAGDYNKYIVNSGITMGTLLSLYEDFPDYFDTLTVKIPESGNGAPDLLNEIAYNLKWMLTMQDPSDGGVYNKVTNANFDGMVMPEACHEPRYVVPKSTAATLDFAAVMAQAYRVFGKFTKVYPGLSESCLKSSVLAWNWALKNPDVAYDQNKMNKEFKPVINTGGYGDSDFTDEFIWAASELFTSTGKNSYLQSVKLFPDNLMPIPTWDNVRLLGYYTLVRSDGKNSSPDLKAIRNRIIKAADELALGVNSGSNMTVFGKAGDFVWGSNSIAANQGILLIQAFKLTRDKKYLNYALGNLDYILGRNSTGYSFVTGYGSKTPKFPHHRLSEADGIADPVPGLIVGGPNPGQQDGCKTYPSRIPDESYTDSVCSYASNEIAINWNAAAAYLAGAIEALFAR